MIVFLEAGTSNVFEIPKFGFIDIFDKEVGDNELYKEIKRTFTTVDLDVVMTILEDPSKPYEKFFNTVSPQTTNFLFRRPQEEATKYIVIHRDAQLKDEAKNLLIEFKKIIRECVDAVRKNISKIQV